MNHFSLHLLSILFLFELKCGFPAHSNPHVERPATNNHITTGYNLSAPDTVIVLPAALHEISGISFIDSNTLACIQDEKGKIYMLNFKTNEIISKDDFYSNGDYEDITVVNQTIYILRSDASLFEVEYVDGKPQKAIPYGLNIPANDNEGLCFDKVHNRLLIASKGNSGKGAEFKTRRDIYGFDLQTKKLIPEPVFTLDEDDIKEFAIDQKSEVPLKLKKNGEKELIIKLRPSAIGIHPINKKLFLISGPDLLFFIFSPQGKLEHLEALDPKIFIQPEGLSFMDNGDLYISNEGQEKQPTLLRFNFKP